MVSWTLRVCSPGSTVSLRTAELAGGCLAQSGCRKAAVAVWGDVLAFSDMAGALEDPQENRDGSRVREKHLQSDLLQDELLGELDGREREELIAWISATEPQSPDVSSSPAPPCFIAQLPDFPQHSRELNEEARAATRTPTGPFWGPPPSLGQLSELLQGRPLLLPAVAPPELPLSTPLAAPAPPSLHSAQLMDVVDFTVACF